jgi:hypothetical protein
VRGVPFVEVLLLLSFGLDAISPPDSEQDAAWKGDSAPAARGEGPPDEGKLRFGREGRTPMVSQTCPLTRVRFVAFSLFLLLGTLGGTLGCATQMWDDVRSNDRSFALVFGHTEPLKVLSESTSGDQRARALRELPEPQTHGGSPQEQDNVVKILVKAAGSERHAICRLAAIESLRKFQDPRAVEGLKDAYYNASSFTADTATVIRCQALAGLGETKNPAAVDLLVKVVQEPPSEGPEVEKQQKLDERIAAARALGNFSHYQATSALVKVMQSEKDVAMRQCTHQSLIAATGKKLPDDAKAWQDLLQQNNGNRPPDGLANLPPARPTLQQTGGKKENPEK